MGITGKDGKLAIARQAAGGLGLVGDIVRIDRSVIDGLMPGFIPVVAPLAVGEDGETFNVNADPFAARLAAALGAEKLVLMTDVEGVLDAGGKLLPSLTADQARGCIAQRVITEGPASSHPTPMGPLPDWLS